MEIMRGGREKIDLLWGTRDEVDENAGVSLKNVKWSEQCANFSMDPFNTKSKA